ncbi:MAG TPA: restriction endonuclease [Pyrinomonadaceae bacterium]|jgi:DNA-binding CsgD family transcriptional regulator
MTDLESEDYKPEKVNPKNIGYLVDAIFGIPIDEERDLPELTQNENLSIEISKLFEEVLYSLTPREEKVIRMRFGLQASGKFYTQAEVGQYFAITRYKLRKIESKSLRKLRHPSRTKFVKEYLQQAINRKTNDVVPAEQNYVIEQIKKLEPELIRHLKKYENDICLINPLVFEHLIAEFFASWGFHDVRLVGQNRQTSADIFVAHTINPLGVENRIFVEVKRWRKKVGVEIINQVLGAFLGEKEKFGWHGSLIVTVAGFTEFEKWSREELKLKGLMLKDKTDLTMWLKDYKECENGLWLPEPKKLI